MKANTRSIEQSPVTSPKSTTSSTRPEYSAPSTSKDESHSTPNGAPSSSHNQKRLTSPVDNSSKSMSMLDLWAYENRNEVLTFAEQLEKKIWEAENSRLENVVKDGAGTA